MAEERSYLDMLTGLMSAFSPGEAEARVEPLDIKSQQLMNAVASGATMPESSRERNPLMTGRFDPALRQVYQQVLQRAQERPETVGVRTPMPYPPELEGTVGAYYPDVKDIVIREHNPLYSGANRYTAVVPTAMPYQQTLTHELMHFLLQHMQPELLKKGLPPSFHNLFQRFSPEQRAMYNPAMLETLLGSTPAQHRFINYVLGDSSTPVHSGPTGAEQPALEYLAERTPFPPANVSGNPVTRDIWAVVLNRLFSDPQLLQRALAPLRQPAGGR